MPLKWACNESHQARICAAEMIHLKKARELARRDGMSNEEIQKRCEGTSGGLT